MNPTHPIKPTIREALASTGSGVLTLAGLITIVADYSEIGVPMVVVGSVWLLVSIIVYIRQLQEHIRSLEGDIRDVFTVEAVPELCGGLLPQEVYLLVTFRGTGIAKGTSVQALAGFDGASEFYLWASAGGDGRFMDLVAGAAARLDVGAVAFESSMRKIGWSPKVYGKEGSFRWAGREEHELNHTWDIAVTAADPVGARSIIRLTLAASLVPREDAQVATIKFTAKPLDPTSYIQP